MGRETVTIPSSLLAIANNDEPLLSCLPERMIKILEQLLTKDILGSDCSALCFIFVG